MGVGKGTPGGDRKRLKALEGRTGKRLPVSGLGSSSPPSEPESGVLSASHGRIHGDSVLQVKPQDPRRSAHLGLTVLNGEVGAVFRLLDHGVVHLMLLELMCKCFVEDSCIYAHQSTDL